MARASAGRPASPLASQAVQASVADLGNPNNARLPQGLKNPIRRAFPHGISIQDWYWYETHKNANGRVPADESMPPSVVTQFGVENYRQGGRYFQFEAYWSNPAFFAGIANLRDYLVTVAGCPAAAARDQHRSE